VISQVVKRPLAFSDLAKAWLFFAEYSEINADRFIDMLEEKFALLATQPQMGRARPELREHLRSFAIKRYIAFYVAAADGIERVRLLPAARDITVEDFATAGNA
jgi:toxin ParE1/3/4